MKDDGKCVQCGGERVEGSTLCVDCLVALIGEQGELVRENKILKETLSLNRQLLSVVTEKYRKLQEIIETYKKEGDR
jgi:hypothetical protein